MRIDRIIRQVSTGMDLASRSKNREEGGVRMGEAEPQPFTSSQMCYACAFVARNELRGPYTVDALSALRIDLGLRRRTIREALFTSEASIRQIGDRDA